MQSIENITMWEVYVAYVLKMVLKHVLFHFLINLRAKLTSVHVNF